MLKLLGIRKVRRLFMSVFDVILNASITGLGSGAGVAIGTYFAQKTLIENLEKLKNKREVKKE